MSRQDWKAAKGKIKAFGLRVFGCLLVFVVEPLETFRSVVVLEGKVYVPGEVEHHLVECCQAVLFHLLSLWPFRVPFYTCVSVY